MSNVNYVSVYGFATEKGARPQYLYQKLREGKVPNDIYVVDQKDDKPYFIREKAEAWWDGLLKAREERAVTQASVVRSNKVEYMVPEPHQMLEMVIGFLGATKSGKKIASELQVVLDELKAGTLE